MSALASSGSQGLARAGYGAAASSRSRFLNAAASFASSLANCSRAAFSAGVSPLGAALCVSLAGMEVCFFCSWSGVLFYRSTAACVCPSVPCGTPKFSSFLFLFACGPMHSMQLRLRQRSWPPLVSARVPPFRLLRPLLLALKAACALSSTASGSGSWLSEVSPLAPLPPDEELPQPATAPAPAIRMSPSSRNLNILRCFSR